MLNVLALLIAVPLGVWMFFRWFERSNVYHPTRSWWNQPTDLGRPYEDVRFPARDGVELSAWYFPAATNAPFREFVVLLSHGNGGNISHRLPLYELLLDLGVGVLAYDYRGYGRSAGRPDEAGTYLDAEGALDWLNRRGFPSRRVVALGESLGGAVAAELASRHPDLRGLILQSTFTNIPDLGAELFPFLPVRTLARFRYDTHSKLPRIQVPILILHSRVDTLVRFSHAERNHAVAREPKWLREIEGDHNDQPDTSPEVYAAAVREFLERQGP